MSGYDGQEEALEPEALLRAHVARILDRSAVPAEDRADVAEELFGHLWQRWHDEVAAGLDSEAAAASAIDAFGGSDELAPELSLAFHSRLFASTIGILLPAVVPPDGRPHGFTRSRVLLAIVALFSAAGIAIYAWSQPLTPLRELIFLIGTAFSLSMTVLAYRALGRQQRWALILVQLLAATLIVDGLAELVLKPVTIQFFAILALFVLPAARGPEMARWIAGSRRIGAGLGLAIAAAVLLPWTIGPALAAMPDPTVATADDLAMRVTVTCERGSEGVTGGSVQVDLRWSRTDLFPYGNFGFWRGMTDTDKLGIQSEPGNYYVPGQTFVEHMQYGLAFVSQSFVDVETGRDAASNVETSSSAGFFPYIGAWGSPIDPGTIVAGRSYRGTYGFQLAQPTPTEDAPVFQVRYDHQHRWGTEAIATCGETVAGHEVLTPDQPIATYP